ncbi:MAG: phosphoribosylaminoimidazolesuccinocarboxamide synthase [Cyclobacteriaceae bacterium]
MQTIKETNYQFPNQEKVVHGKVRDIYFFKDKVALITSDRISAFDVILPEPIPFKGQILNQIAAHFLDSTKHIVPNWVVAVPDPNVTVGIKCQPYPVEMVVRGYLAGHAWREYKAGKRTICGVALPEGLKESDRLPTPIVTPTTKAEEGHDLDISKEEIIAQGLIDKAEYEQLEKYSLALFAHGSKMAKERGLLLVDTKYEFGKSEDTIYLIDEIHTPDSSRYFYATSYDAIQKENGKQKQLSKEFVREWLMENGFQGKEGQKVPKMTSEVIQSISERYIELYEGITGQPFKKADTTDINKRISENISHCL